MRDDELMHYANMGAEYLAHHGVKGMKHGVRRWQYKDGSLTPEGRIHYGYNSKESTGAHDDSGPENQNREQAPKTSNNGGGKEKWQNEELYRQYRAVNEQNKFDEEYAKYKKNHPEPPLPWSKKPTGEKAAVIASTAYNVANDKAVNEALKTLAKNDKEKKKNKARAMNAATMHNLSNQQLQAVIDRKRLEKTYLDETTPEVESGYEKTMRMLSVVGAAGATTLTVLQVANMVKQMKG